LNKFLLCFLCFASPHSCPEKEEELNDDGNEPPPPAPPTPLEWSQPDDVLCLGHANFWLCYTYFHVCVYGDRLPLNSSMHHTDLPTPPHIPPTLGRIPHLTCAIPLNPIQKLLPQPFITVSSWSMVIYPVA
jgi:hypothetical protein